MPDGSRRRQFSPNTAKRRRYAIHRARRFARRFAAKEWTDDQETITRRRSHDERVCGLTLTRAALEPV